jgi:ubiquinone/menaquinone biosynthesis C-methylase UbiE
MMPDLAPDVRAHRDWLLSLSSVPDAGLWVDLGCGTGDDALTVAARCLQPELRIVGLDASAKNIELAIANRGGDSRVVFREHRLTANLPFESRTVDVVYCNNLLECVGDRAAFVRDIARVLKPGGRTVMAHWDWDSQLFDASDKQLVRRLVHGFADWQQAWMDYSDGWMGRRLWGTFAATGLFEGTLHARVLTNTTYASPWYGHARAQDFRSLVKRDLATERGYQRFIAEQEALSAEGRYFYSITGFAYVGRRRAA